MKFFQPDMMFQSVFDIPPSVFIENDKEVVIFDIDNTVVDYGTARPNDRLKLYFEELERAGIKIAFVSNNKRERVHIFNLDLGYFYIHEAKKPFSTGVRACLKHFGAKKENVVYVGDQIFTDCLAAHGAGIEFFMVAPVDRKESSFFKLKRFFEKPFTKAFKNRQKNKK